MCAATWTTLAVVAAVALAPAPAGALPPPVRHRPLPVSEGRPATVLLGTRADATRVSTRARAGRCAARRAIRATVRLDGRLLGRVRLHSGRWRALSFPAPAAPGPHAIRVSVTGRPGCSRATFDELRLVHPATPVVAQGVTRRGPRRIIPVNAATPSVLALGHDARMQQTFLTAFDGLTPENEMKMGLAEPRRGAFSFAPADALVDYALSHGKTARGHTLIWHSQLPAWLTSRPWSRAEMLDVLHQWIGTIVARYRGKVVDWDVLNELFDESGAWRTDSPWYKALGPDVAEAALRAAHDADPGARLFINDFDIEWPGPKQDAVYQLVADLRARGVPLDGVGIQAHWSIGDVPPEATLLQTLRRFAALGVRIELTELDVMTDHQPDALVRQAAAYAMAGRVCQAVSSCDRVTVWGISDRDSWRGAANRPLLFDDQFQAKPAYAALRDALAP